MVSREIWAKVVDSMKQQCVLVVANFITELEKCFPMQELLNVTRVVYSQYWLILKVEITFPRHMAIMQAHFGHPKIFGNSNTFDGPLVNLTLLDQQFTFFKLTMQNHCQVAILHPLDYNPTTCLWEKVRSSSIFNISIQSDLILLNFA
jgi:hypothetical protein